MNEAQDFFRQGVLLLREKQDIQEARRLLTESLRRDPQNEMAWLWLSRTMNNSEKRMQCIDRALAINPQNEQALALKQKYSADSPPAPKQKNQQHLILALLKKGDQLVEEGDVEGAIEQWVRILEIEVDHELAMRHAVGYLSRLKYLDDAKELVWRAIDAGTKHPSIYLTAIDIARYNRDTVEEDALCERMIGLPEIDDDAVAPIIQRLIDMDEVGRAEELLEKALAKHPNSQRFLTLMGAVCEKMEREADAMRYYDRAARMGISTREGREADKRLAEKPAVLTDRERGSMALAWREAAGVGVFYLLLAWQDAGMNLLALGFSRWLGVALGMVGGYLLITATSSPQQQPLARWLGGEVPENPPPPEKKPYEDEVRLPGLVQEPTSLPIIPQMFRILFAIGGLIVLLLAAWLVFGSALELLLNPVPPFDLPNIYELLE